MISKLRKKLIILFLIFTMSAFSVVLTLMGIYTVSRVRNSQTQYVNNLADSLLEQLQAGSSLDELDLTYYCLLYTSFYHMFGLTDAAGLDTTSTIPAISYKDLAADILALPKETCLDSALERVSEILNACSQKNVLPSRVIQYFVRFLDELGYHISGVSIASHDQIVERIECIRNAVSQEELSLHLEQALTTFFRPTDTSAAQTEQYSSEVLQAISYIRENYSRKISLASVAEHVGLSSGYLCRIFKEETGVSINAYINNLRMTHAGELLADKNSYIKEVAISVGFEDQLYFSRLF